MKPFSGGGVKEYLNIIISQIPVLSVEAMGAPIPNNATMLVKAGWFPSFNKPCPVVCKEKGLVAEHETYSVPALPNARTHRCKVTVLLLAAANQWGSVYGNNFDAANFAPFCIATDIFGKTNRYDRFLCLCARPAS